MDRRSVFGPLWRWVWLAAMLAFWWSPAGAALAAAGDSASASPAAAAPAAVVKLYLPGVLNGRPVTPPPSNGGNQPPPSGGSLPAAIVGTWFAGSLLPYNFYDPNTGQWQGTNGLGQMYVFGENGEYTYTAFARTQYGTCSGEVSVYKQGTGRVQGSNLVLQPSTSRTRTVTVCGSRDESTVDGSLDAVTIGWVLGYDNWGRRQLRISEGELVTDYSKQGMADELVGAWSRNGVVSSGFYDAQTQTFATPESEGGWFRFNADGSYSMGEYAHATDDQGCLLTGWVYQAGTVSVSGGSLTVSPSTGIARVENACRPGQPQQAPYVGESQTYTWQFWDRTTAPELVLIPLDYYREYVFLPE